MATSDEVTWGDVEGLIRDGVITPRGGVVLTNAWNEVTRVIPDDFVLVRSFEYTSPDELRDAIEAAVNAAVADALTTVLGRFFNFVSSAAQTTRMHVSGSVFYPATLAGVNPVVRARIKIYPLDPATLLHAVVSNVQLGTPIAESVTDYQGRYYVSMNFGPGDGLYLASVTGEDGRDGRFPLVFNAITAEFFPIIVTPDWLGAGGWVLGYRRKNVDFRGDMSPAQAIELADTIFKLVTEKLVRSHMAQIDHIEYFFIDHKTYIWQLEKKLLKDPLINTLDCVPCPQYQPYSNIPGVAVRPNRAPTGFFRVLPLPDYDIWGVNGYINPIYNDVSANLRPLVPVELTPNNVDKFRTAAQLAKYIGRSASSARTSFHFNAHAAMMGPFANMMTAAAATIFWPVHALMVDIYDEWVSSQFGKDHGPYQLGNRSQNVEEPDSPRWHYTEIFKITGKHEIWHCFQRHVIYERHDRPFDPVFDHADVAVCNPLDEHHNKADESWVHYSHWENRTIGWQWQMSGHGHQSPAGGHGGHGHHGHDHGHSHGAITPPKLKKPAPMAKLLDGAWAASAAGPALEEKAVTLIDCAAVSVKTTTDRVTGRVILLAKDTEGKLCLLRPVLDDCDKCSAAKFICHHLPFGQVEDYDVAMMADNTLRIASIDALSGILTIRAESAYNSNDFSTIVYRKHLSWRLFQVKFVKAATGALHAFTSNLQPITDVPDKDPRLPTQQPCDHHGTLFHCFERSGGEWDTDPQPISEECIASFVLEADVRPGSNVIHVVGINAHTGQIACTRVPGGHPDPSAGRYHWQALPQPETGFFYLCSTRHKDGTPQVFAIDSTGTVFESRKLADEEWADLSRIAQRPIMGRRHRGILAELDYTGCIKIFVHAEDNFAYTCEQEEPNGATYIGWMNV